MKSLKNANVKGKTVLVRADFNVFPVKPHELRIEKTIPTIKYLLSNNAKVILLTHIEENKKNPEKKKKKTKNFKNFGGARGIFKETELSPAPPRGHASIVLLPKL